MVEMLQGAAGAPLDRRSLLKGVALAGLGVAATRCASGGAPPAVVGTHPAAAATAEDTVQMIFTAALIAEDLATTFYYHGLLGEVIQDHRLAGAEGSALTVSTLGSAGNVGYLRAALAEEISHADLMRQLIGRADAAADPVQTFYFPEGSFEDLATFLSTLDALENAFVGAYLAAVRQFSTMAARLAVPAANAADIAVQRDPRGAAYTSGQLIYFAEVSAAILGIEAEHRALGRVIGLSIPANDRCYQQTAGIRTVYNGANSAVAALAPFVKPGAKGFGAEGYSLRASRAGAARLTLPCAGGLPAAS
ncbi:MAG TPA: ferritin-like domain-containing protein [Thermoanaerobaculia bacterium]|jgi:hypothetical protein|nr:ferritin-like domain-containing protein [Thermoanaerobaculia bacterium]